MVNRNVEFYMMILPKLNFFKRMSNSELNLIRQKSIIHQYGKGQVLFYQDDPKDYYYFLFEGLLKFERLDENAEYGFVDFVRGKTFFAYESLFSSGRHHYSAYSHTQVDVMMIPDYVIDEIVAANMEQLMYMYGKMAEIVALNQRRIQLTTIKNAVDRIENVLALWMTGLAVERLEYLEIPFPMTITDLGLMAGTTRETASRTVKQLSEEGRIRFSRQSVIYDDPDYFNQLLD